MKKHLLIASIFLLGTLVSQAQWQPDVRLTNNPALSLTNQYTNGRCTASSGDTVHIVWYDTRDGASPEIYYNRSTNGGTTWGTDTRLTNDSAASQTPCISASGSVVNAVWTDNRDGFHAEVYYKRSTDGGLSWGADTRLTNDPAGSWGASVSASGLLVHVIWLDGRNACLLY